MPPTNTCSLCENNAKAEDSIKCSKCTNVLHYVCLNMTESDVKKILPMNKARWKCPSCKDSQQQQQLKQLKTNSPRVVLNKRPDLTEQQPDSGSIVNIDTSALIKYIDDKFSSLMTEIVTMKSSFESLVYTVSTYEKRICALEEKVSSLSNCSEKLTQSEQEVALLNSTVNQLQEQINRQAQSSLRNNIEIIGLNEHPQENLLHSIILLGRKIGVDLSDTDVDWVTRAGPRPSRAASTETQNKHLSRPVVVRLLRSSKRRELIKAGHSRPKLMSQDLGVPGPERKIYINERLTTTNRHLFRDARRCARFHHFKYCWVSDGVIHVRKKEGAQVIQINNIQDLVSRVGPFPESQSQDGVPGRPVAASSYVATE